MAGSTQQMSPWPFIYQAGQLVALCSSMLGVHLETRTGSGPDELESLSRFQSSLRGMLVHACRVSTSSHL